MLFGKIRPGLAKAVELGASVAFLGYYMLTKIAPFVCKMLIDEVKLRYNV